MIKKIYIDLNAVVTRDGLFQIFASVFSFPNYFGNNWDAFFDIMYSLDSETIISENDVSSITWVHLIFQNFDIFEDKFSEEDMNQFCRILVDLSANKEYRWDHLSFTFELAYSSLYWG